MEHAGRALAGAVRERTDGPVTILAGNGGNGGGGLCCARHLRNRGVEVRVVLDRAPDYLSGPAAHHHATLAEMGVPVAVGPEEGDPDAGTVVDALVGYGLSGPLRDTAAELVEAIPETATVLSLDVPSGMDATTGERPGVAIDADSVVTLALPKTGLTEFGATLLLADIGLPAGVYDALDIPAFAFESDTVGITPS
jgi:NAD(P)H-hydrate epimerase